MAHFKSTFTTLKRFSEILKCCSQRWALSFHDTRVPSVIVCLTRSLRRVETESRFLRTLHASLPRFCVQLEFYAYYTRKCALTRPLCGIRRSGRGPIKCGDIPNLHSTTTTVMAVLFLQFPDAYHMFWKWTQPPPRFRCVRRTHTTIFHLSKYPEIW